MKLQLKYFLAFSILLGAVGERIFPKFVQLAEDPFIPQALASANYDAEGVKKSPMGGFGPGRSCLP